MWMVIGALAAGAFLALAAAPEGWLLAGSKPANYDTGVDQQTIYNSHPSAYLKAKSDSDGFGTLMQSFSAAQYAGKRVRFSAWVKSEGVSQWAGLWMRIDPASGGAPMAFDNMQNRPIKGTSDWRKYEVVLDVNAKAGGVNFGILLAGPGAVWMNSTNLEVVGPEVPITTSASAAKDGPVNLGFDK
jgi:hypothetical protein